ncbi:hypothetical protein GO497_21895 [Acidovorax citrulli]|nr:hypothetical protein [Paracidovorax citrulli]
MKLPWFRVYTEMVDNETLKLVAFEDRWHFIALLCLKGQGLLDKDEATALKLRKVAVKMGLDLRTLEEVARRLDEVGLIDRETLQPRNWDDRQMRSDADTTAAERKRRQRQREKGDLRSPRKRCHGDVTRDNRDSHAYRYRYRRRRRKRTCCRTGGRGGSCRAGRCACGSASTSQACSRCFASPCGLDVARRLGGMGRAGAAGPGRRWCAPRRRLLRRLLACEGRRGRPQGRLAGDLAQLGAACRRSAGCDDAHRAARPGPRRPDRNLRPACGPPAHGGGGTHGGAEGARRRGFAAAQRFMAGDSGVIDVPARTASPRLAGGAR